MNQAWTAESTYQHLGAHNVYYVKCNYWVRTGVILPVLSHLTFKAYQADILFMF
jgi:hypothetical protein